MARGAQVRIAALLLLSLVANGCTETVYRGMNDPARDAWQRPHAVIQSLDIASGSRVADLGAGGGYFTFPLAQAVGPEGKIYAVDIDKRSLHVIREEAAKRGGLPSNVELILASPEDPRLPQNGVDLIFTCNTYHHLSNRSLYMRSLARYLRPGGRLAIIDYTPSGWAWLFGHATAKDTVREELAAAGYRLVQDFPILENQHFQVFSVSAP